MKIRLYAIVSLLLTISFHSFAQDVHVCDRLTGTNSLQAYIRGSTVTAVDLLGYASPGDDGDGHFEWVSGVSIPGGAPAPATGSVFVAAATGSGTGYWKRIIYSGAVNALWFGLTAEANNMSNATVAANNDTAIANAIAAAAYLRMKVYIPGTLSGYAYHFRHTIVIDKPIEVFGDFGETNTELRMDTLHSGIQVKNGGYVFTVAMKNIRVQYGYSPDAYNPTPNLAYNGIEVSTIVNFDNVQVIGFPGDGFKMFGHGNLTSPYSDVSNSKMLNCAARGNSNNGFEIGGAEANNIHFEGCDTRGNYFWGIYDSSKLGNTYTSIHSTSNGKYCNGAGTGNVNGGGFKTEGGVNYSRFIGCYSELTDVRAELSSKTIIIGGFAEDEGQDIAGHPYTINGANSAATVFGDQGKVIIRPGYVVPGSVFATEGGPGGLGLRTTAATGDGGTYFMTYNNTDKYATVKYAGAGDIIGYTGSTTASTIMGFPSGRNISSRFLVPGGVYLSVDNNRLSFRNLRFGTASPTGGSTEYAAGDFVINTDYANANVIGWRCSATGTPGTWQTVTASTSSAQNGLSISSSNVELGGSTLSHNSAIDLSTYSLDLAVSGTNKISFNNDASAGGVISINSNKFLYTKGTYGTFLGKNSGNVSVSGDYNTGIGGNALTAVTSGFSNTAIGAVALNANTTASINTAVGWNAMLNTTTGGENAAVGGEAMKNNTTGSLCAAIGRQALLANTTGHSNAAIGSHALETNTTGALNSGIGPYSGKNATTGNYNVYIGAYSGPASGGPVTASNKLYINSSSAANTSPLIGGDFYQGRVGINKDVTTLLFNLDVNGTGRFAEGVIIGAPSYTTYANAWSAGYNCMVKGKLGAEEMVVLAYGSWPDYVFEKNYSLRSLKEVEQYINVNKHLPGIASVEEMKKKDGIEVGKMQTQLLEKVEELTLYAIDADKKNEAANEKIQALEKRLAALEKLLTNKQ